MPIPCKRFTADEYSELWAYGVGAFRWMEDPEGRRTMLLLVPYVRRGGHNPKYDRDYEPLVLYMSSEQNNWAQPGPRNGWDGNEDSPTLNPSILVPGGWHGFMHSGQLTDA